jgi:hypothetical protein
MKNNFNMIIGGIILLLESNYILHKDTLSIKNIFKTTADSSLATQKKSMKNLKVIAFDADDTLFINETYLMKRKKSSH